MDYIDAHIHIADCKDWKDLPDVLVCSSTHSLDEFLFVEEKARQNPQRMLPPKTPVKSRINTSTIPLNNLVTNIIPP